MKIIDINEEELLQAAKDGDKKALETLIRNNCDKVKGYILKLTCDPYLTEDILQETLVSAIFNIKSFEPRAKFSTWLIKIACNKYRDYLRKHKETEDLLETIPSACSVEDHVLQKNEIEKLFSILKSIPANKRNVFILKHYYGYTYEEIAAIIGCSIGTVRSRLHYAIKEIISKFKEDEKSE